MSEIIEPTVTALPDMGTPIKGVLYAGLIIKDGPEAHRIQCPLRRS